jgi:hypothetical protein
MKLQDQLSAARDAIVEIAMLVFGKWVCVEELGIPLTARPDVAHCNQGLRLHLDFLGWKAQEDLLWWFR